MSNAIYFIGINSAGVAESFDVVAILVDVKEGLI